MAQKRNAKRTRQRPHAFAAKISNYQFETVLWQFILDCPERQAAGHIRLSENSIAAIYGKLRSFFFNAGLFPDIYNGRSPDEGGREGHEVAEFALIEFHLNRNKAKRGSLDSAATGPDYHFSESCWRHSFEPLRMERPAEHINRLMMHQALAFVKRFGPVGSRLPLTLDQRRQGLALALDQMNQRLIWLERNAGRFRDQGTRGELRALRIS